MTAATIIWPALAVFHVPAAWMPLQVVAAVAAGGALGALGFLLGRRARRGHR